MGKVVNNELGSRHHRGRNFVKLLRLAYRNLFRNRRRTLFAILIAASGCTALSIAMGYYSFSIYSLQELAIRNGFGGSAGSGHVQVINAATSEQGREQYLQPSLVSLILQDADVDYVLPRIEFGGLLSNGDRSVPFKGYGVEVDNEMRLWGGLSAINPRLRLAEQLLPLRSGKTGIILGRTLASSLHAKAGDMMIMYSTTVEGTLNGMDVELLGIMSTGVSETDKYYLLTNREVAQKLLNTQKLSLLAVMFRNRDHFEKKLDHLRSLLADYHLDRLKLTPWYKDAAFYASIRDIFNIIFSFMGTIILVIVLLSCWNIMHMTTMERIREIGTLKAIGLSTGNINRIFVLEAMLIGVTGASIGMVGQLVISRVINAMQIIMPPVPGMSRPYTLQVYAATWLHPLIAFGILAVIMVSGFSSLMVIKKYTIVESLEHT